MLQHLGSGAADAQAAATLAARRPPLPERFAETVPAGQLRALMAIADCGSESLAAQWLGLTQPAVHAALQEIGRSTRLNSSHSQISYAVFCLKKKKKTAIMESEPRSP